MEEENFSKYKGGKLSEVVIVSLSPFLEKIKNSGIKKVLEGFIGGNPNEFVIKKIRSQLSKRRFVDLGKSMGKIAIQYRFGGIQIEPVGLLRMLIKRITITDVQIIYSFNSIITQIERKYILDDTYLINKLDDIIFNLSGTEIYKPKNSEEKTLYDLAMLILMNYYKSTDNKPDWIKPAFETIKRGVFIKKWIDFLADYISEMISKVSENIFFDFKVTFDSFAIRTFLNKKTNKGQVSKLISMCGINIRKIIYSFAKSYVSPSFIRGASEIILEIATKFLSDINRNDMKIQEEDCFSDTFWSLTVSLGENACRDRNFRWFTNKDNKEAFLEYSLSENFETFKRIQSKASESFKLVPNIHFGLVSSFKAVSVIEHSVELQGIPKGRLFYRLCFGDTYTPVYHLNISKSIDRTKFMVLADSQGMVKSDYDRFLVLFENSLKKFGDVDFSVHLGDFVDDGNNEEYWKWLFSSDAWKNCPIVPLGGNHEARINTLSLKIGVKNPIASHFNLTKVPAQNSVGGMYYSFVHNNITFIVLNTNTGFDEEIDKTQYNFALSAAKNATTPWKILLTHKTPYSNGPHHKDPDVKGIGKQIKALAYEGKIDVVFGGHDHVYVRTPFLAQDDIVDQEKVIDADCRNCYKVFDFSEGTIFITPGTAGVKNYASDDYDQFPKEVSPKINSQVCCEVVADESVLHFKAFSFDFESKEFKDLDSFKLIKNKISKSFIDGATVSKIIKNIPDCPWVDRSFALRRAFMLYKKLDYAEKITVDNYSDLLDLNDHNKSLKVITNSRIVTVKNKKEFLNAVKDKKVGTIITLAEEIKFENKFSLKSKVVIDRPLCIRGVAKLTHVRFILKNNAFLFLADSVCVDNTRKPFSLYASRSCFEMFDTSTLILSDNATINNGYGIGIKKFSINIVGENCKVYLVSSGQNFSLNGMVFSSSALSKIVVNSGKYLSSNNRYTFDVNGNLIVKGGFITSIKGFVNSNIFVLGGIIGEKDNKQSIIPIESLGRVNFDSGKIRQVNGVSAVVNSRKRTDINFKNNFCAEGKILYR